MEGGEERARDSVVFWKVTSLDPSGVPSGSSKDLLFRSAETLGLVIKLCISTSK